MIRTQIYLDESIYRDLTTLAKQENKAMAQVTREILKDGLTKRRTVDRSGKTALLRLLDLRITGGPPDLSTNIDHYLYGAPKKQ